MVALIFLALRLVVALFKSKSPSDRTNDVVQEVLLTVHRARATYGALRSFQATLPLPRSGPKPSESAI
jgi:DNA-directed RNA polymerase specialized sigma24 family protein